jgi:hypothetical protein
VKQGPGPKNLSTNQANGYPRPSGTEVGSGPSVRLTVTGWLKIAVLTGLVVWCVFAWWQLRAARRAAAAVSRTLRIGWPEHGSPQAGMRERLVFAAEKMHEGAFASVVSALGPVDSLDKDDRTRAQRFFGKAATLRERFVLASDSARALEADGVDVTAVRDALARVLRSAAERDPRVVAAQLDLAEQALAAVDPSTGFLAGANDAEAVAAMARRIQPAYQLGQDLVTEGHTAVQKLVARASARFKAKEYRDAVSLLRLAGDLLGVGLDFAAAEEAAPEWFERLEPVQAAIPARQAEAAIELAEAIIGGKSASETTTALVNKSRRELAAGRQSEAAWWVTVALNALGMTDAAIAAAAATNQEVDE